MPSIDERIVSMAFENKVFEQRIAVTMATLAKLDTTIKSIGNTNGLDKIEAQASKVTLQAPMSALDKLKAKLGFDTAPAAFASLENASAQTTFAAPLSALDKLKAKLGFSSANQVFSELESSSSRVTFAAPQSALEKLKSKLGFASSSQAFSDLEASSNRVSFSTPSTAVDRLKSKMGTLSAGDTFSNLERESGKVSFEPLTRAIEGISGKFSVMSLAAGAAFGGLTAQIASKSAAMVKNVALGPITQGFQEYSTNLNAIQTTLANTESKGSTLKDVNKTLAQLNTYSDQTIYNFGEMAKNIGTFTAAGVGLDQSAESIKGIANLAALSGSNSQQASGAMYQLSQAIASGKVNLQDWNSVLTAGIGGEVFQKALFNTGKAMGTLKDVPVGQTFEQWTKAGNTFRNSISATQKETTSSTDGMKKAQTDAAKTVSDAQKSAADSIESASERVKDAQSNAAEAAQAAADKVKEAQTSAAEAIQSASDKVREAQVGVGEAARKSAEDVAVATKAQSDTIKQAGEDVKSALDGVREARRRLAEAMKPPNSDELQAAADNLRTAQLDQADLSGAVSDAQRDQTRAAQDLANAEFKLAHLKPDATADERLSAQRAVEDARKRVTDAADAQTRALLRQRAATRGVGQAEKDLQTTRQKGSKKDPNVKGAQDALTQATKNYKDAQIKAQDDIAAAADRVKDAQKKASEDQIKAGQRLADAQKDQAKTIIDSKKRVADAQTDQAKTIIDSQKSITDAQKDQTKTIEDAQQKIADAHVTAAEKINAAKEKITGKADKGPDTWLTSDVLTNTLRQFTGDMTTAQLKAQGLTDDQIKAVQQTAKTAKKSATEVKTLGQVFSVAKEAIGTGWADTFALIFGNFGEAKKTFTDLSQFIGAFISKASAARNAVIGEWKALGGRTQLIKGIQAAFEAIMSVIKPIGAAFREIFPKTTGKQLFEMTQGFVKLAKSLAITPETADLLKRIFAGLFAVIHIGWSIVKDFVGVIFDLLGVVGNSSGGFLDLIAGIGDFLVSVDVALTKGGLLKALFKGIGAVLALPLHLLGAVGKAIAHLFGVDTGDKGKGFESSLQNTSDKLGPLKVLVDKAVEAWHKFVDIIGKVKTALEPWFSQMVDKFSGIGDVLANAFKGLNINTIFQGLQSGFVGGIFVVLKQALGEGGLGSKLLENLTKPMKEVNGLLSGLTTQLQAMQTKLRAETLLAIAAAILVLAAGIYVLSTINPDKLTTAMTAVAVGLGELVLAMKLLTAGEGKLAMLTLPVLALGIMGLATAILILSVAMKVFATMSWEDIAKGFAGVTGSLVGIGIAMRTMPSGPAMIIQAVGLTLLAVAMNLLAFAVKTFSTLSWEELVRGLAGVVGSILGIAAAMTLMPLTLPITAAGLVILGIGLGAIAGAVRSFGAMDIFKLVQGLVGMTLAIAGIGLAISFIPPTIALTAAGLLIVGQAMVVTAGAIALLGSLSIGTLIKGIIALAATLVVLALGLTLMIVSLPGAAALLVAAAALAVLVPVLGLLGTMKWSTIFKGLTAIALALLTIGVVGLIAVPALLLLGVALIPLGLAFLLIAASVKIFANAIALLSSEGQKGFALMMTALTAFVAFLPNLLLSWIKGLIAIADQLSVVAPKVIAALGKILTIVIAFIIAETPKLALAIGLLITAILKVLIDNTPKIIAAGFKLLNDLLDGISNNIKSVENKVTDIVIKFLDTLTARAPDLIDAGAKTLQAFLQGVTGKVGAVVGAVANMIIQFINALSRNIVKVVAAGRDLMSRFIGAIAAAVPTLITKGTGIILAFLDGIEKAIPKLRVKAISVARTFLNNVADGLASLADVGFKAIIRFLNGLERAIRQNSRQLSDAGAGVASAIIDAMIQTFGRLGGVLRKALEAVFKLLPGWARKILGISSPSKVFLKIGEQTMMGMALGLTSGGDGVNQSITSVAEGVISTAKNTLGNVPNLLDGLMDMDPVIAPVLDLSNVEQEAGKLGSLIPSSLITGAASFSQAAVISDQTTSLPTTAVTPDAVPTTIKFEQNNYSPDPLSNIEIYRQTNNQISRIKSLVGVP